MKFPSLTITILGAGHLGTSILKSLISQGHTNLIATRKNAAELKKLQPLSPSLILTTNNKEAAEKADVIILTSKEYSFEEIAKDLKNITDKKLLISLGPTFTLTKLKTLFKTRNVRLMMPIDPREDIINYTTDQDVTSEDEKTVEYIFGKNILKTPEEFMPAATAYVVFRCIMNSFFEPLVQQGIAEGLDEKTARKIMGEILISTGQEIKDGVSAEERLKNASGGFNEQSFTLRLNKNLEPARTLIQELFQKTCKDLKNT